VADPTRSASSRWPRSSGSPRAASTGTSRTGGRCWARSSTRGSARSSTIVIARVEHEAGDARARLRGLFRLADALGDLLQTDLAVRDWSRRDRAVAERLRRVDNRRIAFMRALFADFCPDEEEVEARCLIAFSLWIGNNFIAADHGARSRAQVLALVERRLLT
jgi:hypothetical protein